MVGLMKARDEHVTEHANSTELLESMQEEMDALLKEKSVVEDELARLEIQLEGETKILESQVQRLERERDELGTRYNQLEARFDQSACGQEELEEQLKKVTTDTGLLRLELKSKMDSRAQQAAAATEALEVANARAMQAEAICAELRDQVVSLEKRLGEAQAILEVSKEQGDVAAEAVQGGGRRKVRVHRCNRWPSVRPENEEAAEGDEVGGGCGLTQ